jgi:5-bromo-4-chloroindolyl phosphate hydrolysis protein
MKEIFLGIITAVIFLAVWAVGENLVISAVSSFACLAIIIVTMKSLEKEKKAKLTMVQDNSEFGKIRRSIIKHTASILQYIDRFKALKVEKDVITMLTSIYRTCLKITEALDDDANLHTKLNDFSSNYLPGLVSILDTYDNLAEVAFKTDEAQKFASQFYLFLKQITDAFDKKYYSLFSSDVMDSKAEMSAMSTIFKAEGLVDNKDFSIKEEDNINEKDI